MWIGTSDGLNRYDGIEFIEYRNLPDNWVDRIPNIRIDTVGNIWSGGLLHRIDRKSGKKTFFYVDIGDQLDIIGGQNDFILGPDKKIYLALSLGMFSKSTYDDDSVFYEVKVPPFEPEYNRISILKFGPDNNLWIGTDQGFFILNPADNRETYFNSLNYPEEKYVTDFIFDRSGDLWAIFTTELVKYNISTGLTEKYRLPLSGQAVLTKIYQTNDGRIWLGTYERGLFSLDPGDNQFKCFLDAIDVSALYEDHSGRLWIGTQSSGVFVYDPLMNYFSKIPVTPKNKPIDSFHCDIMLNHENKGLWIGARSYGLLYYDFETGKTTAIDSSNIMIDLLYEDNTGLVWYNHLNYLLCYDPKHNTIRKIRHPVPNQFPVLNRGNALTKIVSFNNMLIISSDYGQVYAFDKETDRFTLIYENVKHLIRTMYVTNDNLWLCVYNLGILVLDKSFNPVDTIFHNDPDSRLLSNTIMAIHKDKYDSLWVGGYGGLSRYNPSIDELETVMPCKKPANYLTSILEDDEGNLWIGSGRGIYKYDRAGHRLILFDMSHGMPPGRFFVSSAAVSGDGLMYFGGSNGIVRFRPEMVRTNAEPPPVVFTGFIISGSGKKLRNRTGEIHDNINHLESIHLKYFENSFTIRYAALNYTSPLQNQYKYFLEGLENDWNYVGNQSLATYTNLDGGKYTFHLNGSNNDGVWNPDPRTLLIKVDKPPGKRWWAITIYLMFISASIIAFYFYNLRKIRLQHQLEIKNRETRNLAEINDAKSRFFTNISHEFRTPLTLILDPANRMMADVHVSARHKKYLKIISVNAQRLMSLINQILDLPKLRNGQVSLRVEQVNFRDYVIPIFSSFKSRAEALNLEYELIFSHNDITLWIDREKMRDILINLISNAFKFCSHGKITIEISQIPEKVLLKVEDTGIGIPADQVNLIFDEYYQVRSPNNQNFAGSGIGLAIVREYLNLHHATISVESEEGRGTTFIITLLKGNMHFDQAEIVFDKGKEESGSIPDEKPVSLKSNCNGNGGANSNKYTVLLIEDDIEIGSYLTDALSGKYNIISALNGAEGLEKTLRYHPDVVISDIMMPVMDGYTYCETVKQDERISHIPVILLTARVEHNDKIRGLDSGADDYLEKPFSLDELELRIKNHIERFRKLQVWFNKELKFGSNNDISLSLQDSFLHKVFSFIEQYYKDYQFGVEKLSELVSMSRNHFSRKVKRTTGETPNELIRNYRLRQAKSLLENKVNVTEACFSSGFNNLSYFSKCFFAYYGRHPSDIGRA